MASRAPVIERRTLAARRYATKPDDLAELRVIIATMRDVPREALESFPDMIHLLRRLSGRLDGVAARLELVRQDTKPTPRTRLAASPPADRAAIAAGVFDRAPRKAPQRREKTRTVTTRKGRSVRVVERPSMQMELMV